MKSVTNKMSEMEIQMWGNSIQPAINETNEYYYLITCCKKLMTAEKENSFLIHSYSIYISHPSSPSLIYFHKNMAIDAAAAMAFQTKPPTTIELAAFDHKNDRHCMKHHSFMCIRKHVSLSFNNAGKKLTFVTVIR